MKVLHFTDSLRAGGKERQLAELVKGLTSRQICKCIVVSMSYDNHYCDDSNIEIHYLPRRLKKDLGQFIRFYRFIKSMRPDIIQTWDFMTSIYVIPAAKLLNIKLINGMARDAPPFNGLDNRLFWAQVSFPFADAIVANSHAGLKAYGAPPHKSHCIYNGFDFQRLEAANLERKRFLPFGIDTKYIVGMVATFGENKDYRVFFKAAELVLRHRRDVAFVAIGEGTSGADCERVIPSHIRSNVLMMGKQHNVEAIISLFNIGVLATSNKHGEGISNSIVEYMASGKPVVATDAGGTKELVIDGVTGFLAPKGDYKAMARYLSNLLQNKDMAAEMGNAGRKRISDVFSINRMIDEYFSLYMKILARQ